MDGVLFGGIVGAIACGFLGFAVLALSGGGWSFLFELMGIWFFTGHMTGGDGIFADPGRKANFLLGLLVLGPFDFVVGPIIGAVIAALGIRSSATRKSVADEPGPVA